MEPAPALTNMNTGFDEFYRDHRAKLVATLNAATRCGADAATEAVDEAFVRALANWRRVGGNAAPPRACRRTACHLSSAMSPTFRSRRTPKIPMPEISAQTDASLGFHRDP